MEEVQTEILGWDLLNDVVRAATTNGGGKRGGGGAGKRAPGLRAPPKFTTLEEYVRHFRCDLAGVCGLRL